jgi:acyl carrier protein
MTKQDIICGAIAEATKRPRDTIGGATRLAEDLGLRSLKRVELAVALEDKLGQKVTDAVVMKAKTVNDLFAALGV